MKILPILLATAGVGAVILAGCSRRQDNVVIVVIDTLRQDHLATYGYARDTAPFLGELAREGAVFDGLSPTSWTKPAAASLLTGLHPVHHQTFDRWDRLPEGAALGERLGREGYQTLAASANRWVSPVFGFGGGFDHFVLKNNAKGKVLNRELFPFVDRLKPPFFLYVHYLDPHAPYHPETSWDGKPLPAPLRVQARIEVQDLDSAHTYPRSPEFLARVRDSYDGEIRGTDDALRELVEHLRHRGLMDATILVVAADHGEEMGEHGRMSHGQSLYQEVLRIPLVFHAPHRFESRRFGRASLLDVAPTLMELLDLKPRREDPPFDGISLAPFLTRKKPWPAVDRRPFLEHLDFTDGANLALLAGTEKIVLGKDQKELYDLSADPGEKHNLLGPPGSLAAFARLAGELAAEHNALSQSALARRSADVDAALEKQLADLGYVNASQPVRQRTIPRRIDLPVLDWLPWEPFGRLPSCVNLAAADSDRELLQGWYDTENGGRWSERRAALLLTAPVTGHADHLLLSGINFRLAPVRLRVKVEGMPVLDKKLPAGPFQLEAGVAHKLVKEPSKVEIETDTAFIPSKQGGGSADSRQLGIFLTSVCYQTH
jgi:arylsulfatase A-like enzyme